MAERSLWEFKIVNPDGKVLAILSKCVKRRVNLGLNLAGEATFTYDLKDLFDLATTSGTTIKALLGFGINTLECYRDEELFFSGQILTGVKKIDGVRAIIDVKALGWFWLLGTRYAGVDAVREFDAVDAGDIAWTLIDEAQDEVFGDFGITQGTIDASTDKTITYSRKNIREAIEDLSSTNNNTGFEFEITPGKIFNAHFPFKGSDKSDTVKFLYPGKGVRSLEEQSDATTLINNVLALGFGISRQEVSAERSDAISQGIFVRRELILPVKDISNTVVLGDMADKVINERANVVPLYKLRVWGNDNTPSLDQYSVGDYVQVKIDQEFLSVDRALRVFEIRVDIGDNDLEKIDLVVGLI